MVRPLTRTLAALVVALALLAVAPATTGARSDAADAGTWRQRGYTQVTVAPDTLATLTSLGVTPGVVAPGVVATADPLAVRFPITGYSFTNLRIRHSGGITLTAGSTTVTVTDFNIDLGRLRVSGNVSGIGRVDLFKIRFSDRLDLGLVKLVLTADAAGALNGAFGTDALTENFLFGFATPRPFARL
jgi:hypothetical protein